MPDDPWLQLCERARHAPVRPTPPVPVRAWRVGPSPMTRQLRRNARQAAMLYAAVLLAVPAAGLLAARLPASLRSFPAALVDGVAHGLLPPALGSIILEPSAHDH